MISAYAIVIGAKQRIFPFEASIKSALQLSNEYCIVYDPRFDNPEIFTSLDSRVKTIEHYYDFMEWDFINVALTKARRACIGNWCLQISLDEVLHEKDTNTYLETIDFAENNNIEGIDVKFINPVNDYVLTSSGGSRQIITNNIPELYHRTSDSMIGHCDSEIWDGKYILPQFDDFSYYDERTNNWFNDPYKLFPKYSSADLPTNNRVWVWHYACFNPSRKNEQGRQNSIWQNKTFNRSKKYDITELIRLFKEQIVVNNEDAKESLKYYIGNGFIHEDLIHPRLAKDWIELMKF